MKLTLAIGCIFLGSVLCQDSGESPSSRGGGNGRASESDDADFVKLTTSTGSPVDDDDNSKTAGRFGPVVLSDFNLLDKLAHFDHERIPERVVHAKGAGAHGYFEVTHDVTMFTKASVFSRIGKITPVFMRFSSVGGERGSPDTNRDPRGFSIKHYTDEGIWDMTGNNTPVFFIRDPHKFPDFIHTQKRNPQTNLPDADMFWDFLSLTPESLHQVTILFSDLGTPYGFRHMHGYTSHTFRWVNRQGDGNWIKLHYLTNQGIRNFTDPEASAMKSIDPDFATRDLFDHIDAGDFPSWTAHYQIMSEQEGDEFDLDIFDVTKKWPETEYPLNPFGRLVLDRNPENYFAEVEQAAFSPGHLVPGIEVSHDKMLQARVFAYPDTQRHRLGVNNRQIPINTPIGCPVANYQRDGFMAVNGNGGSGSNYFPNSVEGSPQPDEKFAESHIDVTGSIGRFRPRTGDDFLQPGEMWRKMSDQDQENLVNNIAGHLSRAKRQIRERQIEHFVSADSEYGRRVAEAISSLVL